MSCDPNAGAQLSRVEVREEHERLWFGGEGRLRERDEYWQEQGQHRLMKSVLVCSNKSFQAVVWLRKLIVSDILVQPQKQRHRKDLVMGWYFDC